jgi:hypothetical protein
MAVVDIIVEVDPEMTSEIDRDELVGLIETTSALERQRITAEIPTATLHDLLSIVEHEQPAEESPPRNHVVVAISAVVTLGVGLGAAALFW